MDDAGGVGFREASRHLDRDVERLVDPELATGEPRLERLAAVVGHRDEQLPVGRVADFVDGADVGVVEAGGGLRLLQETPFGVGVVAQLGRQELERRVAVEPRVARPVDDAHAAAAEPVADLIGADARTGREGGRHASEVGL